MTSTRLGARQSAYERWLSLEEAGRAVEDRDFRAVVGHEVKVNREGEGGGVLPWNAGSSGSAALEPPSGGSSWSCSVVVLVCDGG